MNNNKRLEKLESLIMETCIDETTDLELSSWMKEHSARSMHIQVFSGNPENENDVVAPDRLQDAYVKRMRTTVVRRLGDRATGCPSDWMELIDEDWEWINR